MGAVLVGRWQPRASLGSRDYDLKNQCPHHENPYEKADGACELASPDEVAEPGGQTHDREAFEQPGNALDFCRAAAAKTKETMIEAPRMERFLNLSIAGLSSERAVGAQEVGSRVRS